MSFITFADGTSNLPENLLDGIRLLPCTYTIDGIPGTYDGNLSSFQAHEYYQQLSQGKVVHTSLLNTQLFLDNFRPVLAQGRDIIYISMSSGISGTYSAAKLAVEDLAEEFPDRFVHIVDSRTCGLGTGMQAVHAARLSRDGVDVREAAQILDDDVEHCCSYFTVDDLNFLKRTGRVSGPTAAIATVLHIKPILFGASDGHIISCAKVRGRQRSIDGLVSKYIEKAVEPENQTVYISHGDCPQDAEALAQKVCAAAKPKELIICDHEPFSGAHVGPGMLALFFHGTER